MNKILISISFLLLFCYLSKAQIINIITNDLDVLPQGMGGERAPKLIIQKNLRYPEIAAEQGISGNVIVSFIINPKGEITDIKLVNEVHPLLDEEVLRVTRLTNGHWISGEKDGQKVDTHIEMSISFTTNFVSGTDLYYQLANLYFNDSNYLEALQYLEEIRRREPYDYDNFFKLATSYEQTGKITDACKYWQRLAFLNQQVEENKIKDCKNYLLFEENKAVNYRFDGKEYGLCTFMQHNLRYPEKSLNKKVIGLSISSIMITPNGEIEKISIVNSIDKWIDKEVLRLLKLTGKHWNKNDTITINQTFYVQIGFDMNNMLKNAELQPPFINNSYFIKPVYITAISMVPGNDPLPDKTLILRCNQLINNGKYAEALPFIDDLIKRYPYCKDFYQVRMLINRKLNKTERINEDIQKRVVFIPGVSLDELLMPLLQEN